MNIEERKTNIVYNVQDFIFIFSLFIMQNLVVLMGPRQLYYEKGNPKYIFISPEPFAQTLTL